MTIRGASLRVERRVPLPAVFLFHVYWSLEWKRRNSINRTARDVHKRASNSYNKKHSYSTNLLRFYEKNIYHQSEKGVHKYFVGRKSYLLKSVTVELSAKLFLLPFEHVYLRQKPMRSVYFYVRRPKITYYVGSVYIVARSASAVIGLSRAQCH